MNISKFIKSFVLIFYATTAVASFGTEQQKDPQEQEKPEIFVWYEIKKFAAEYWLPITAIVGTWMLKSYLYDSGCKVIDKILSINSSGQVDHAAGEKERTGARTSLFYKTTAIAIAGLSAGICLDKRFVKPRITNLEAIQKQMVKDLKK